MKANLYDVTMILHHETCNAVLVSEDGDREKAIWLPKSQIEYVHGEGREVEIAMPEWLAIQKELV